MQLFKKTFLETVVMFDNLKFAALPVIGTFCLAGSDVRKGMGTGVIE
jgi:hypothetical protein